MKTYAEMTAELEKLAAHNERLVSGPRSARAQIVELKNDLERVGDPPNSYATFLRRCEGTTIDVLHNGRRLRVATAASLDLDALTPGTESRLNEALAAVEAVPQGDSGNVVPVVEALADSRVLVAVAPDDTRVLRAARAPSPRRPSTPATTCSWTCATSSCSSGSTAPRSPIWCSSRCRRCHSARSAGSASRSRRSATRSSRPSCSRTSTAPTGRGPRRASRSTARPVAARP
ncbi:hypothetical protein [Brachybacterium sp. GPGPB12]|uniref:hypothetical protein n=1 Tax=Brachybacterium sp. GPGPB12 TaxID=3023517 RepID=UPI003134313E